MDGKYIILYIEPEFWVLLDLWRNNTNGIKKCQGVFFFFCFTFPLSNFMNHMLTIRNVHHHYVFLVHSVYSRYSFPMH